MPEKETSKINGQRKAILFRIKKLKNNIGRLTPKINAIEKPVKTPNSSEDRAGKGSRQSDVIIKSLFSIIFTFY